ncbi:hypothetical protein D7030_00060 [Flavobacteriaceae bacterium AU392]|nr:hypothetical protein D1817_14375 [Flavobacteriaceae bacterium]RKM86927.1 hypothetical protein D7030_00060 [Flavobacteriaceae bacterium AU392]
MKKILGLMIFMLVLQVNAQDNNELVKHYEAYYKQMKIQGDVQGIINALTHLNVLSPNVARKDTLAAYYMNNNKHLQALNTIGIEMNANDSNLALEVKAVSLQNLNQAQRAIPPFEELFKRNSNVFVAYELADLKIQTNNLVDAKQYIDYGLANAKDDQKRSYFERQQPYQVSVKAAFTYLKGILKYSEDQKANIGAAIALFDEALTLAPNFNLAQISRNALESQKNPQPETKN